MARNCSELSGKLTNVLDSGTLTNSHKRLAEIITEGMAILDMDVVQGQLLEA